MLLFGKWKPSEHGFSVNYWKVSLSQNNRHEEVPAVPSLGGFGGLKADGYWHSYLLQWCLPGSGSWLVIDMEAGRAGS